MNAMATSYAPTGAEQTMLLFRPHSFKEVKAHIVEMQNRNAIIFNIEDLPKQELYRALDYLDGFMACCGGSLKKVSESAVLVAPGSIDVEDNTYTEPEFEVDFSAFTAL